MIQKQENLLLQSMFHLAKQPTKLKEALLKRFSAAAKLAESQ
tara:strand:- start:712 stop:837 length:126 start_codon:yes stop_codon:yes gene_type:complete